jgi:hypothetical protein
MYREAPKKARALGPAMSALVPMPLALPAVLPEPPPPATETVLPVGAMRRIFLLPESATKTSPVGG